MHQSGKFWNIFYPNKVCLSINLLSVISILLLIMTVFFIACNNTPDNEFLKRDIDRLEDEIEANPDNLYARVELALLYSDAGMNNKAVSELKAVLELNDSYQSALMALGYVYLSMGSYEEALEPYTKMIELNKDNPMRHVSRQLESVYYYMGTAHYHMGDYNKAIQSFEEALVIDRTDADAWYLLGDSYRCTQQYNKAIESFEKAASFVPDFKDVYHGLGLCYEATGQNELALYAEAMEDYCAGNIEKAVSQLEQMVEVNRDYAQVYLGLGLAYEKQGEIEKAISAYEQVLNINPDIWLARVKSEALQSRK